MTYTAAHSSTDWVEVWKTLFCNFQARTKTLVIKVAVNACVLAEVEGGGGRWDLV
jgi:hypothetical protein